MIGGSRTGGKGGSCVGAEANQPEQQPLQPLVFRHTRPLAQACGGGADGYGVSHTVWRRAAEGSGRQRSPGECASSRVRVVWSRAGEETCLHGLPACLPAPHCPLPSVPLLAARASSDDGAGGLARAVGPVRRPARVALHAAAAARVACGAAEEEVHGREEAPWLADQLAAASYQSPHETQRQTASQLPPLAHPTVGRVAARVDAGGALVAQDGRLSVAALAPPKDRPGAEGEGEGGVCRHWRWPLCRRRVVDKGGRGEGRVGAAARGDEAAAL